MKRMVLFLSIFLLPTLILGWVNLAEAQQAEKVYRLGYLPFFGPFTSRTLKRFRQNLRELGYIEGQNLVIEWRSANGEEERLPVVAAELVRLNVDVIVAQGAPHMVRLWQQATRTTPIVMNGVRVDPVEAGLIESLARPGGNVTGVINLDWKLHGKRLELLKEVSPGLSRVAILWDEEEQELGKQAIEATAQALGVQIQSLDPWDGLDSAFSEISHERADGLVVTNSGFNLRHRGPIIEFAANSRLPTIYAASRFARAGGLMSYSADREHLRRRVAIYVDKIFKGAKPADLPVEQPRKFELIINLKTAKKLGFMFSPQFLARADKVIK